MINNIKKTIQKHKMIQSGEDVAVALSGGMDSVSLLFVLHELQKELDFFLSAVHINHQLRGDDSDDDELFCKNLCERLNIKFTVLTYNINEIAKKNKKSIELTARKIRYDSFELLKADKIATAHNQNDFLETVILNLIRGTGIKGLCGIPAKRGKIIRPLLYSSREEILKYIFENNIDYVHDKTNDETVYTRNKIRHGIIPRLKEINPKVEETVQKMSARLLEADDYIESEAKKNETFDIFELQKLHIAIRKRFLSNLVLEKGIELSQNIFENLNTIIENGTGRTGLKNGYSALISKGKLHIYKGSNKKIYKNFDINLHGQIISKEDFEKIHKNVFINAVDYDKIQFDIKNLKIRSRLEGDYIKIKSKGTKTIKKYMNEIGIPPHKRAATALLACGSKILLIDKTVADESVLINDNTKNVLIVNFIKNN